MADSSEKPTPPEKLPDHIVADLEELSPENLRKTIIHAQELLQFQAEPDDTVTPEPGEDIIRATEHDGYTEVVKQFTCAEGCSECPHGPYLYHVTEEPQPEGGTEPRWSFIGRVQIDED